MKHNRVQYQTHFGSCRITGNVMQKAGDVKCPNLHRDRRRLYHLPSQDRTELWRV